MEKLQQKVGFTFERDKDILFLGDKSSELSSQPQTKVQNKNSITKLIDLKTQRNINKLTSIMSEIRYISLKCLKFKYEHFR